MNNPLIAPLASPDEIISFFWLLAALFAFAGGIFLLFVLASRKRKTMLALQMTGLNHQCQPVVTEIAFEEKLSAVSMLAERQLLSTKMGKHVLLYELTKFRNYFQGETVKVIEDYYVEKKLYQLSFKKLHSRSKHLKISALNELVEMDYQPAVRTILRYLKSERDTELIENALVSLARLDYRLCIKEILNRDFFLTDWLQLQVIQVLDEIKADDLPPLRTWMLQSGSWSHIVFGCRLVAFSKSQDHVETLKELLWHPNERIRNEAIRTFGMLHYDLITSTLLTLFGSESVKNKCEIIRTLSFFNQRECLPFLAGCIQNETEEIQKAAREAIRKLNKAGEFPGLHTPIIALLQPSDLYLAQAG